MRRAGLILAVMVSVGCATYEPDVIPADGPRVVLYVHGIDCVGCAKEIDAAVRRLPGVAAVAVDRHQGTVTVAVAEAAPTPTQRLVEVIEGLGKYRVLKTEP